MTLLSVKNVSVDLGGRQVLRNVSLDVAAGEFVGLIGPNGAGKSTLMRAVMGLLASPGAIELGGQNASGLNRAARARTVAYIAQSRDVAWAMPVEALVALGRTPHLQRFAPPGAADRLAIDSAMRRLDIAYLRERPATELSGGELARVLIARALAQDTPLLLADEPTSGLDPAHQISVMRLFQSLASEGRSIIASTHDLGLAALFCSRLILLDGGAVVADGPPEAVLTPENLAAVYNVRAIFNEAEGRMLLQPVDIIE